MGKPLFDPETGELDAQREQELAALRIIAETAVAQAEEDLKLARQMLAEADAELRDAGFAPGMSIQRADKAVVYTEKQDRKAQRVDAAACQEFAEQMLDLGLGSRTYKPPTAASIKENRARLTAVGVDVSKILPAPDVVTTTVIEVIDL